MTFEDTDTEFRFKWTGGIGDASTLLDVDGSLTGGANTLSLPERTVRGAQRDGDFNGFSVRAESTGSWDDYVDDLVKWR